MARQLLSARKWSRLGNGSSLVWEEARAVAARSLHEKLVSRDRQASSCSVWCVGSLACANSDAGRNLFLSSKQASKPSSKPFSQLNHTCQCHSFNRPPGLSQPVFWDSNNHFMPQLLFDTLDSTGHILLIPKMGFSSNFQNIFFSLTPPCMHTEPRLYSLCLVNTSFSFHHPSDQSAVDRRNTVVQSFHSPL